MALVDLVGELVGRLPGLSPILAEKFVNRALTSIYGERNWAFLVADGVLICPAQITAGTASIIQYTATVTLDATASAAVLPQTLAAAVPGIQQLQIRFSATQPAAPQMYSIIAADTTVPAAIVLTLDRVVVEPTAAASGLQIYRALVVPPISDFLRWESLVDLANAITLTSARLTVTSRDFDRMDPQRTATGLSYWLGAWGANRISNYATGATIPNATQPESTPIYEFWPHPTTGQTWYVRFRRKGVTLVNPSDTPPDLIEDNLIIQRVLYEHAYPFAAANIANFPSFKGANWPSLTLAAQRNYNKELLDAKRNDNERQLQDVWNRGHSLRPVRPFGRYDVPGYPLDSNFLQSHLIRF